MSKKPYYIGVGEYSSCKNKDIYIKWTSMLKRCYSEKYLEKNKTYKKVSICKEWHDFQNFAKWYIENSISGYDLDKDILQFGLEYKIYSPKTCMFVHPKINNFISNLILEVNPKIEKDLSYRLWYNGKYGGRFNCLKELNSKRKVLMINEIIDFLCEYDSLLNLDIKIYFSKTINSLEVI